MNGKNIILVTGQSGVRVRECIERLKIKYVSIEKQIREESGIPFEQFIGLPQYLQYEYWTKTFEKILKENKLLKSPILTFHAVYYHQRKRELFSPVNFEKMAKKIRNKVKMVIVFIDDIFDVYRRLMESNQMFEDVLDKSQTTQLDAIYSSIFNIVSLLNWREMEIAMSRALANLLNTKMFIVSTKHPCFILERLIETSIENLKIYYWSHPITSIREKAEQFLPGFVGKLESLLEKILKRSDTILFYPTSIDELIIKRVKEDNDKYLYYPEIIQRWSLPYEDKLIAPPLSYKAKKINPLNPLEYSMNLKKSNPTRHAISHLLSLLWDLIYLKQIISRDYSLVEQSQNGIIACRPYFQGVRAGGVIGELSYNFNLMEKQSFRDCFVFSCKEDWNKWIVNRLFVQLNNYLKKAPADLNEHREKWIQENYNISEKSLGEIRDKLENEVLPTDYDFKFPRGKSPWSSDSYTEKSDRKDKAFKKIYDDIIVDEIRLNISENIKKRFFYETYDTEIKLFDGAYKFVVDKLEEKEKK